MAAMLNEDPPALLQTAQTSPPGLQKIVNRCLSKNQEQRFQHPADLAFALEALSDSGSTATAALQQPGTYGKRDRARLPLGRSCWQSREHSFIGGHGRLLLQ
jgi:hypothetical protein